MPHEKRHLPTSKTSLRTSLDKFQSQVYKYSKELPKIYSLTVGTDLRSASRSLNEYFARAYTAPERKTRLKNQLKMICVLEYMGCVINASTLNGATNDSAEDLLTSILDIFEQTDRWYKYTARSRDEARTGTESAAPDVQEPCGSLDLEDLRINSH